MNGCVLVRGSDENARKLAADSWTGGAQRQEDWAWLWVRLNGDEE